jgi:hypothetical protein
MKYLFVFILFLPFLLVYGEHREAMGREYQTEVLERKLVNDLKAGDAVIVRDKVGYGDVFIPPLFKPDARTRGNSSPLCIECHLPIPLRITITSGIPANAAAKT